MITLLTLLYPPPIFPLSSLYLPILPPELLRLSYIHIRRVYTTSRARVLAQQRYRLNDVIVPPTIARYAKISEILNNPFPSLSLLASPRPFSTSNAFAVR